MSGSWAPRLHSFRRMTLLYLFYCSLPVHAWYKFHTNAIFAATNLNSWRTYVHIKSDEKEGHSLYIRSHRAQQNSQCLRMHSRHPPAAGWCCHGLSRMRHSSSWVSTTWKMQHQTRSCDRTVDVVDAPPTSYFRLPVPQRCLDIS